MGKACAVVRIFSTSLRLSSTDKDRHSSSPPPAVASRSRTETRKLSRRPSRSSASFFFFSSEDVVTTALDITDDAAVEAFVASVPVRFGRLDVALCVLSCAFLIAADLLSETAPEYSERPETLEN